MTPASDDARFDESIGQGASVVRAAIVDRAKLDGAETKHGDRPLFDAVSAAFTDRNRFERAEVDCASRRDECLVSKRDATPRPAS
jgi:hypothetical protein